MSNSAWCDLIKKCTVLNLHGKCHNPNCNCQKQITFTPQELQLDGTGFKSTRKKTFKGSQKARILFPKPTINTLAPVIRMPVGARLNNPKVEQATTNLLKSISGGKILKLTDLHGNRLRLKVVLKHFK